MGIKHCVGWCLIQQAKLLEADPEADLKSVYKRVDPLLRSTVRKRITGLRRSVVLLTNISNNAAHVARLAYLEHVGEYADPDSDGQVDAKFSAASVEDKKKQPTRWAYSFSALCCLLLLVTVAVVLQTAPDHWLNPELQAPAPDAFISGGRPLPGDQKLRQFFEDSLANFVLALDRSRRGENEPSDPYYLEQMASAQADINAKAASLLGEEATQAISTVMLRSRDIVLDNAESEGFSQQVQTFNTAMAKRGLGYHLDGTVTRHRVSGQQRVFLASFLVEWVAFYQSGATTVRALRWSRVDKLNFDRAVLGFTREDMTDALVLVDRVDAWLVRQVLPALAPGAALKIVDGDAVDTSWIAGLEQASGQQVRRQAGQLVGDSDDISELGEVIVKRSRIFDSWNRQLNKRGVAVHRPETYALSTDRYKAVQQAVLATEWSELRYLQNRLQSGALLAAYRQLRRAMAQSVERHEVQHRLDYAQGTLKSLPPQLENYLGPLTTENGEVNQRARGALAELSAYLSELAREPQLVKLNLAFFASNLFNSAQWGSDECYAALVVFEELAKSHLETAPELLKNRAIDRQALAKIFLQLLATEDQQLSNMAKQLWQDLFQKPLPPIKPLHRPK